MPLKPDERRQRQAVLSAIRDIGGELRSLIRLLNPFQNIEASAGPQDVAKNEPGEPRPQATINIIARRSNAEIQDDQRALEAEHAFRKKSIRVQWCLFGATMLAFGAAAYYAFIARQQKDTMDRQWDAMNKTFKEVEKQTLSAKNAADAAKDAADIAKDALYSVQRAFVIFGQGMEMNGIPGNDPTKVGAVEFRPRMENSGSTPTKSFRHRANWRILPWTFPTTFRFPEQGTPGTTPYVIGPKASITGTVFRLTPAQLLIVNQRSNQTGITGLYFYGWATYNDVFANTPLHISMFCTEMTEIVGDPNMPGRAQVSWQACPRHNCNDAECDGEPYDGKVWQSSANHK